MAVKQISRVQIREGNESDLPNPNLADGELGFTKDTGKLFIGSPTLPFLLGRNTFPFKNTEILTEWSDIGDSKLTHEYEFRKISSGTDPYSNPGARQSTAAWTILRKFQEKLDEVVSVKDYGAVGDGVADDTVPILRAILDITNPLIGVFRPLRFPAGIYKITRPILLLPRAVWLGDGPGSIQGVSSPFAKESNTVIMLDTISATTSPAVVRTADSGILDSLGGVGDPSSYDTTILPQLGLQIGVNGFDLPENIVVSGIKFISKGNTDVVRLDRASNVKFINCAFQSDYDCVNSAKAIGAKYVNTTDSIAVRIDGLGDSIDPHDITLTDCLFSKTTYGFFITDEVKNVTISNSVFTDAFKGVTLGEDSTYGASYVGLGELTSPNNGAGTGATSGPIAFRVNNSRFTMIQDSGFSIFSANTGSVSSFNRYDDIGFNCPAIPPLPTNTPSAPAINLANTSVRNVSVGDGFFYTGSTDSLKVTFDSAGTNLILSPPVISIAGGGGGGGDPFAALSSAALLDNQTNVSTTISFNPSTSNSAIVQYSIGRGTAFRTGTITIAGDDGATIVNFTDNFTEIGDVSSITTGTGITLSVQLSGGQYVIFYTSTDETPDVNGTIHWSSRSWLNSA